jgi:hypothetical protein
MPDDPGPALGVRGTAWSPETRLYTDGVVAGVDGAPVAVPPHSRVRRVRGTALAAGSGPPGAAPDTPEARGRERARYARARVPGTGTRWAEMAGTALVDLLALLHPNGALVAAASPYWRYVWPRDAAFGAAALCACGLPGDALRVLRYVAGVQEADGTWQARYLPDGSGRVPDGRGTQLDGLGWTLWAAWVWAGTPGAHGAGRAALAGPLRAAAGALCAAVDPVTGLPRPSPDYWEQETDRVTLGTAAPLLLGARCAADLLPRLGDPRAAERCAAAAGALAAGIGRHFAPRGFPRAVPAPEGGGDGPGWAGRDASVAFLLPPFAPAEPGAVGAWRRATGELWLANGGVRPGADWPDTATAWTPQMSLFALTAACLGERGPAEERLDWLAARRTRLGALPEKVTAAGRPAAVAPLGLTAATVLLTLAALDGRPLPMPPVPASAGG